MTRRLAISQAITGDQRASESTLLPLLQRSDLAAYRARAFALAIVGKSEEAVSIAQTMLPGSLSNRMAPYLRYMPRLTRAQQAAAANLGRFPPADQIGRDSPAIAALSQQAAAPAQLAALAPGARLEPSGQPLGSSASAAAATRERRSSREPVVRQPAPQAAAGLQPPPSKPWPSRDSRVVTGISSSARTTTPTPAQTPTPAPAPAPATAPARVASAPSVAQAAPASPVTEPAPQLASAQPVTPQPVVVARADPGTELPPVGGGGQVALAVPAPSAAPRPPLSVAVPAAQPGAAPATAQPAPAPATDPVPDQRTLADAFAEFAQPSAVAPASNAVDITKIDVRREKPPVKEEPKVEKPKPPAHPSRVWVQVATGRDTKALGFDWRRISREAGPLLAKRQPYLAKWGQTNRLVTGPYASEAEAQKAVSDLKKKGLDSFTFTSDEGEAVNPLK